ncbi:MAG: bifunctional aldolase/short-chain dehydrogenase [Burkholderiales bacterium]|jgi:rhamnose utilization protein RhaD (predicted bifunctional aldolase and dehydrogenase)/NAD(P)-dependent dehydrogenase (short-subunit alcohol dehydrogenase family)|nr:bifunctional aldolase/short-chain dehydrogenase [Burkholderiales bacterium]
MQSLWQDAEAARFEGDLGLRVYTSRLLGADKSLVLHGGGNTSVKVRETNRFGEPEDLLYVKGSGWDLETIEAPGFAPVRLAHVVRLAGLDRLSDPDMVNELATNMLRASAPAPSIETILHGAMPFKFVDHTHADAVLAVTNTADGEKRIREIYGDRAVVVGYRLPGFDLAKLVAAEYAKHATPKTVGVVLLNHGIFSFGQSAREAYELMIELVGAAESYLASHGAWSVVPGPEARAPEIAALDFAALRRAIADAAGKPMLLRACTNAKTLAFARHSEVSRISQQGPATPDHVIRTKRLPMLGSDVDAYVQAYREYFAAHAPLASEPKTILDPAPRVVLDPRFGLASVGRTAKDARIVEELYDHTIDVILRAEALGGYVALPAKDIFDVEYWDLEQAKLRKGGTPPAFTGEVALVTGAASGIGKAGVASFLSRGAAVVALDVNPAVASMHDRPDFLGIACDVTDESAVRAAIERGVFAFGGIDMLVLNAGIFSPGRSIKDLGDEEWRRVMHINLDANLALMRTVHPLLKLAPRGGRVVVIGSKNVPAPGIGAAAYSASKAALSQLARIAALEWGADGIRVNTLHPDAVFDTGLWTDAVLAERAKRYGLTVEQYKTRNVLRAEVTSRDVAELAAELCGPLFAKTTGAQIPIDGGNERVI